MVEVTILIPTADNAGLTFPDAHHDVFEAELRGHFGGFQLAPGLVSGQWADAGTIYADALRVYTVAVAGLVADGDKIAAAVGFAKAHYAQLAVYVRYLGVSEIL